VNVPPKAVIAALLCFFVVMGLWFISRNSATFDEPIHYYAGYAYLEYGDFTIAHEAPPLNQEIAALPIYVLSRLHLVSAPRFTTVAENPNAGIDLIYRSPVSASVQLLLARVPMLLLGLGTAVVTASWAHRLWGPSAAIVGTGLAVTAPTLIAHSGIIKPDIALTCFFLSCFYFLWLYRERASWGRLALAGVALGAALGAKAPAIVAVPAIAIIAALDGSGAWRVPGRRGRSPDRGLRHHVDAALLIAVLCAIAIVTLSATYGFADVGLWWDGLQRQLAVSARGQPAFLFGRYSDNGWWYYFPVAFVLKTPTFTLLVIAASLALPRRGTSLGKPEALFLIVPSVLFLVAMMWSRMNIGVRYILPVLPFLFLLASRVATFAPRPLVPVLLAAGIAWNAAATLWVGPHFLASASALAGGPIGLARYLSDSNIDWGQALGELARYMARERIPALYLGYFGMARPGDYGIQYQYIPAYGTEDSGYVLPPNARELLAISVTNLHGEYLIDHDLYAWLRVKKPIATVGYAIYVYDLTGDRESHCHLADAYGAYYDERYQTIERAKCRAPATERPPSP